MGSLLSRLSLFRWRLEWLFLVIAAVGVVLSEEAREARERDPYELIHHGRAATAIVRAAREETRLLGMRRGEMQQELRTFLDLEWFDADGAKRAVENYRVDPETAKLLRIEPGSQLWPAYVNIHYLDRAPPPVSPPAVQMTSIDDGVTSLIFQDKCTPQMHCRMIVLAPDGKTRTEENVDTVDLALQWAPRALWGGLAAFFALLLLRLAGIVENEPSLQ